MLTKQPDIRALRGRRHFSALISGFYLLFLLVGCRAGSAVDVSDLQMPADAFPGVERIQVKSEARATETIDGEPTVIARSLQNQQVLSSAYYRYWMSDQAPKGLFKVKIVLYRDAATALEAWQARFPPVALTGAEALEGIETSFIYDKGREAGWLHGQALLTVIADGQTPSLAAFVAAYEKFLKTM
ncbi:hypothetical protein GYB61_00800 [bacterium]|nr:hypothetical protein [bacterium]